MHDLPSPTVNMAADNIKWRSSRSQGKGCLLNVVWQYCNGNWMQTGFSWLSNWSKQFSIFFFFLPLGVASCCASIQLVPCDAVNRNKVSIRQLAFIFLLSHYMFRPLRAIFRWDIQWTISNTTDPLHVRDLMQRCYLLYIGALTLYSQYMLSFGYKYKSCRHKIVKTANSP
jgi:hypothetical protein